MLKTVQKYPTRHFSRLVLGTAQMSGSYGVVGSNHDFTPDTNRRIIGECRNLNIGYIDTAVAYGEAENRLGEIGISDFKVITKLPRLSDYPDVSTAIEKFISSSMKRLNNSEISGILLHDIGDLKSDNAKSIMDTLQNTKKIGLVEKIGISAYSPDEVYSVIEQFDIDIVQAPLNPFDQRMLSSGCAQRLFNEGIEFHARSIFLQGTLLANHSQLPKFLTKWDLAWKKWSEFVRGNNQYALEICLAFVLHLEEVTRIVVGVHNNNELQQIASAIENLPEQIEYGHLGQDDLDLIDPRRWN